MKLRYSVDMENCFRQAHDCSSGVQVIDVDPKELELEIRNMIADRLMPGEHLGEEVMDVCYLVVADASVDEGALFLPRAWPSDFPDGTGHLITADLPGLEHLVKAVQKEEAEIAEFLTEKKLKYERREIL